MTEERSTTIPVSPIGHVERKEGEFGLSPEDLRQRPARLVLDPDLVEGLLGLKPGDEVLVLYWLHRAARDTLQVHPRGDRSHPLRGVFATRSPTRPNPIGVTITRIRHIEENVVEVIGLDALDRSPLLDIKPHAPAFDTTFSSADDD